MCFIKTQHTEIIFPVATAQDAVTPSFQLIPYHSLLSAMFQPVSKQTRQERSLAHFNSLYSSRRYRRPPPRHRGGYRNFFNWRKRPERKRYPPRYRKYPKHYGRHTSSYRKPANSFVPGGIIIGTQP